MFINHEAVLEKALLLFLAHSDFILHYYFMPFIAIQSHWVARKIEFREIAL